MHYTVLHCTALQCTALCCTVLYCTVLYCTVLYCSVLYCIVLYCTVLYYIVLYCTVLYRYWDGITDNLELMPSHYPGWVMRLYVSSKNLSIGAVTSLCSLQCSQPQFDLCPVIDQPLKSGGWRLTEVFGMIWRFLPVLDPSVDVMVSREQDYIQHYRQHCHCQCLALPWNL